MRRMGAGVWDSAGDLLQEVYSGATAQDYDGPRRYAARQKVVLEYSVWPGCYCGATVGEEAFVLCFEG